MLFHGNRDEFFQCEKCSAKFTERIQAVEHKNFHSGETPHECSFCHKKFMFSWLLLTHRRIFHSQKEPEDDSKCNECNVTFRSNSSLAIHYSSKHKQFDRTRNVCDICGKGFETRRSLRSHKYSHAEMQHNCLICGKIFRTKVVLSRHMKTHTGEKQFSCKYCDRTFRCSHSRLSHERTHTGERPYKCKCSKSFVSSSALRCHEKICYFANIAE